MGTFIVELWSRIFFVLDKLSIFSLVRWLFPKAKSYGFIDAWVLGHLILSISALVTIAAINRPLVEGLIVAYGALRVFEINVYQTNVLLFDEYRAKKGGKTYAVRGYRRLVLLSLHNYVEIIFWFACSYLYFEAEFIPKWAYGHTSLGAVYTSFIAMSTFGDFSVNPKSSIGAAVLLFQSVSGLFMTILTFARFIGLLPKPETTDELEGPTRPRNERGSPGAVTD